MILSYGRIYTNCVDDPSFHAGPQWVDGRVGVALPRLFDLAHDEFPSDRRAEERQGRGERPHRRHPLQAGPSAPL